ncbi:MAG: hypothetical protein KDA60_16050 [Planctomycetales bacterium]|nr:hypothetical protein [Planctomycetales bacterium]
MKVAIGIDDWKQRIFEDILTDYGYEYEVREGLTADMRFIFVQFDDAAKLKRVVEKCQRKAAELKN